LVRRSDAGDAGRAVAFVQQCKQAKPGSEPPKLRPEFSAAPTAIDAPTQKSWNPFSTGCAVGALIIISNSLLASPFRLADVRLWLR